eukprot:m.47522 g.47522  ORF g.47522 m.47522 type:complete len:592 (-) comp10510_c0_seq1:70-1845(-)
MMLYYLLPSLISNAHGYVGCDPEQPYSRNVSMKMLPDTLYMPFPMTGVMYSTTDATLQQAMDKGTISQNSTNRASFGGFEVLVEGGGYTAVWLETQPMAGQMYATRDVKIAIHNSLIFMRTQRLDGRFAGVVNHKNNGTQGEGYLRPEYCLTGSNSCPLINNCSPCCGSLLQGMYLASSAVDAAWYMGLAKDNQQHDFLRELQESLIKFNNWTDTTRNGKTAENGSAALPKGTLWLPGSQDWGGDGFDGYVNSTSPIVSMDMHMYAYDTCNSLALIADMLGNTINSTYWEAKAATVAGWMRTKLWDEGRSACFDHDGEGKIVDVLMHNNLRAMWGGVFSQDMADAFVRDHLMNTSEFFTTAPLPSIAVNSPAFRNGLRNDWSGPPQGLTYQRAIRALTNYGHHAELLLVAQRFIHSVSLTGTFPQQFEPFSGVPMAGDHYGPSIMALFGYVELSQGIFVNVRNRSLYWSAAPFIHTRNKTSGIVNVPTNVNFTQRLGMQNFTQNIEGPAKFGGYLDGWNLFTCEPASVRVRTDLYGNVMSVIGISSTTENVVLHIGSMTYSLTVKPNEEWSVYANGTATLARSVPFTMPHS